MTDQTRFDVDAAQELIAVQIGHAKADLAGDLMESLGAACVEIERLRKIERAAQEMFNFLWNEKQTTEPPRALLDMGIVACESSADYEREEKLAEALGEALGVEDL